MCRAAAISGIAWGPRRGRAFTLVEILIVVTILGILATVVVPHIANAAYEARENTLKDDLRYLRTQIGVYKAQHRDQAPGAGPGVFVDQMTLPTDEAGNTAPAPDATHKLGPYLSKMPANPLNNLNDVKISNALNLASVVDDKSGWLYNPATQQFIANLSGSDGNGSGVPYAKY